MKVSLSKVKLQCAVHGCEQETLQRHHKGCEKMFVRHFAARKGQTQYEAFVARYYEFSYEDIEVLCEHHHKEVHRSYLGTISAHCLTLRKPMCRWTWREADILMRDLRALFDVWLRYKNKELSRREYNAYRDRTNRSTRTRKKEV